MRIFPRDARRYQRAGAPGTVSAACPRGELPANVRVSVTIAGARAGLEGKLQFLASPKRRLYIVNQRPMRGVAGGRDLMIV